MMNICKLLISRQPDILITFVVTEEWLGFIGSQSKPHNIRFRTLPNTIPSEHRRANDFAGFIEAVFTKMEAPFEELLDHLLLDEDDDKQAAAAVSAIIADTYLPWAVDVGNRRNIPVASLWTMSALVFSVFHHFQLLERNGHFPFDLSEKGDELVDYIPGLEPTKLADFPTIFHRAVRQVLHRALASVSKVSKAQYLLLSSVYKLEAKIINTLKEEFSFPVYPVGPTIPHVDISSTIGHNGPKYLEWLETQPVGSVLYVSLGSFLSVSSAQMDEIIAGICNSGVRYFWVTRGDTSRFKDGSADDKGIVVPWCDQLRVLCHASIGGFWTHCGLNSTIESLYAGVPMLTFPIFWDQVPNSKQIVQDWKTGWRAKKPEIGSESLVTRDEITELVKRFMDFNSDERKEMSKRAREVQEICQEAVAENGSSIANFDAFLKDISSA